MRFIIWGDVSIFGETWHIVDTKKEKMVCVPRILGRILYSIMHRKQTVIY